MKTHKRNMVKRVFLLFCLIVGYPFMLLQSQNLVIDSTTFDSGEQLFYSPGTITSPDTCARPVTVMGDAHIEYKAAQYVHLGSGFRTDFSCGGGTFHAYTGSQPPVCPTAIITGEHVFCGSSVLSAASSVNDSGTITSYQWQFNGKKIHDANAMTYSASESGDYTVLVSNSYNCTAISAVFTVLCYPASIPIITGPASVCVGSAGNVYSTQAGMTNYYWSVSAGGMVTGGGLAMNNSITITWVAAGAQTVSVNYTDLYGCMAASPAIFIVQVNPCYSVSGTVKYYKQAGSSIPLDNIELWLMDGETPLASATTTSGTGYYSFDPVKNGAYTITVHNNNKPVGGINATDAAQINWWGAFPSAIEQVRFLAGDVRYDYWMQATDAYMVQYHFVYGTPFTRTIETGTPWTYWKSVGKNIYSNFNPYNGPSEWPMDMPLEVADGPVSYDIFGLVTGDFNTSFIPGNGKVSSEKVQLISGDARQVSANTETELPIRIEHASKVGAVSLVMNFPPELVDVDEVTMAAVDEQPQWTVIGNELRIGWNSRNPVNISAGDIVLNLRLTTTAAFTQGSVIRFTLAPDPLNELADNFCNPIPDAILRMDGINASTVGFDNQPHAGELKLEIHPNPFTEFTNISYMLPLDGEVTLTIHNFLGQELKTLVSEPQPKGDYRLMMDGKKLLPGIYQLTLKLRNNSEELLRTVKLIRTR